MRKLAAIVILGLNSLFVHSQNYFQQKVDYTIDVKLDDTNHSLDGNISMVYHNNSSTALSEIYMHIWANAYKNGETALAKQQYRDGNALLRNGGEKVRGYMDKLDFKVNQESVEWRFDAENIDIAIIQLKTPLQPGESMTITTPFYVKLPSGSVSRLGHIGQSYQITQWYPKPAVFDQAGWHAMPYLNQGEFYSEFGTFDVSITLPKNYVVGATGDLQTQSEIDFLNKKAKEDSSFLFSPELDNKVVDMDFPASDSEYKTIRYKQKDVHDFAWFADKRYYVLKGEVTLPASKRKVTTWAMFTPQHRDLWKKAPEYIGDGTYYYSLWNGDYPYNQVTAVDGTISAGGGMEYPNVTVIGSTGSAESLEIVIVHEVGHNWFYGILGSNERDHGWMDEGMNTLNEIRYIQTKYPGNTRLSDAVLNGRFHMNDLDYHDQADLQYQLLARLGEDQAIETKSADFTSINYGIVMYQKTGLVFHYLKSYLGDEKFDACMHTYYDRWHFKHPQPADMKNVFEELTGENLDWVFGDLIQTRKHVDYRITSVKKDKNGGRTITVKNVGQVNGPIPVTLKTATGDTTLWTKVSTEKKHRLHTTIDFEQAQIDPTNHIPEINRSNNTWTSGKIFKKMEPLKLEFLAGDNEPNRTNLYWTPMVGYNNGDQLMAGILFHNYGVPFKPLQYYFTPMYSTDRQSVSGQGEINYTILPQKRIAQAQIGVQMRSYKLEDGGRGNQNYYAAALPFIQLKMRNPRKNPYWSAIWMNKGLIRYDHLLTESTTTVGGLSSVTGEYNHPDHEWTNELRQEGMLQLDNVGYLTRTSASSTYRYRYAKKKSHWVELRAFAGINWEYNEAPNRSAFGLAISGANGAQDLFFEQVYFNRSYSTGIVSSIRQENMGGMKNTAENVSTKTLFAFNAYVELPLPIPFGIFGDYVLGSNDGQTMNTFYDAGIGYRFRKIVRVYYPIFQSSNLSSSDSSLKGIQNLRLSIQWNIMHRNFSISSLI